MTITLNGTTGVVAPEFDGPLDASNLTGALPAIDGSAVTALTANNLTGALPAIDGSALTGISTTPTTAQVLTATAGASYGAVGSYVMARYLPTGSGATTYPNATRAGSSLYPANTYSANTSGYYSVALSGTWRVMGQSNFYGGSSQGTTGSTQTSLWLRIA